MKKGFTLAEVLITLGIIGVVAALVMPGLIVKNKEHIRNQQFKKAYSTVVNAMNLMQTEFGEFPNCYYRNSVHSGSYITECQHMYDVLASKMNVIKTCKGSVHVSGCIPEYNDVPVSGGCNGFSQAKIFSNSWAYVLSDGTIIFTYTGSSTADMYPLFAMDVNGRKGPNLWGHDIFTFMFDDMGTSTVRLIPGTCAITEKNGISSQAMFEKVIYK